MNEVKNHQLISRVIVGFEPSFDFGFVVDDFASDFVVGEDIVVAEVLEGAGE